MSSPSPPPNACADARYHEAAATFGADLARCAAGYELIPARRHELLQEMHLALWRSLATFAGQCSLRTWVYRVAHNVGASHVQRQTRRADRHALNLDDAADIEDERADVRATDRRLDLEKVLRLVHRLPPLDRQVMLLYLEDLEARAIAEVTGLSARHVATKVHRLKQLLRTQLHEGGPL